MAAKGEIFEAGRAFIEESATGIRTYNQVRIHLMHRYGRKNRDVSEVAQEMRQSPPEGIEFDGTAFIYNP